MKVLKQIIHDGDWLLISEFISVVVLMVTVMKVMAG